MNLPRVTISAPHRSSGKTTLSIGLCKALTGAGYKVQPFKKGPDFIDPMWLSAATGRTCRNLDLFMMGEDKIRESLQKAGADADISIVRDSDRPVSAVLTLYHGDRVMPFWGGGGADARRRHRPADDAVEYVLVHQRAIDE